MKLIMVYLNVRVEKSESIEENEAQAKTKALESFRSNTHENDLYCLTLPMFHKVWSDRKSVV